MCEFLFELFWFGKLYSIKSKTKFLKIAFFLILLTVPAASAQQVGSIRGIVYDKDFDMTLPNATIMIAETGEQVTSTQEGNYVFSQVEPGTYTLVFSKEGYTRQVKADVVVTAGQLTEVNAWLSGDFTEMEEFVVQDVQLGTGTEAALLELRMKSPALMDSISSELMSQAGVGDAAGALKLVAGASIQDDKFAVIRGLPNRYVSSQMNAVRLPSADDDTRAVELDQFPSEVIESIQVKKTFTPDQQGDASGGAVDVVLKGIPEETIFEVGVGSEFNTQVVGQSDFLTYKGGGIDFFGKDGDLDIPANGNFTGGVGTIKDDSPFNYDFDITAGTSFDLSEDIRLGGFASIFYDRDSSFFEDGVDDEFWVVKPGDPMTPQFIQGTPQQGDFKTQLFDVTQASEQVQWGGLGIVGIESENHSISLHNLFTRDAEDTATLAEDTRGKQYFFPGHDPNDPSSPGQENLGAAPFLRNETLQYVERTTRTHQLKGDHTLQFFPEFGIEDTFTSLPPRFDWTLAFSTAERFEPDKRQFGSVWRPAREIQVGGDVIRIPATHSPFKPAENFTLGNLQRTWEDISEDSFQYSLNFEIPFKQWSEEEGYLKLGLFNDEVKREFNQDTFSNFNDNDVRFEGDFEDSFSNAFPDLPNAGPISDGPPFVDVDYEGEQKLFATYGMLDLPLTSYLNVIGGARYESTDISIVNFPERDVTWVPPNSSGQVKLNPGDADVAFAQDDLLPSVGLKLTPWDPFTIRASYSQTVARQTFRELSPIQQQEFLGGDVFIGNPFLQMSSLDNFDLRMDYTPYQGGLLSASFFRKEIEDPIEFVQRFAGFSFTTPVNFPEGEMSGFEFEVRQQMGRFWEQVEGLSIGANATFIDSEVQLPQEEIDAFQAPNIQAPMTSRDMTNAPENLYNLFFSYDLDELGLTGTTFSMFYTIRGDTLVAGAGQSSGNFLPSVYETEHGTLNLTLIQKFGDNWSMKFEAENITDPEIETVYRSEFIDRDNVKTSFRKGIELSLGVTYKF